MKCWGAMRLLKDGGRVPTVDLSTGCARAAWVGQAAVLSKGRIDPRASHPGIPHSAAQGVMVHNAFPSLLPTQKNNFCGLGAFTNVWLFCI